MGEKAEGLGNGLESLMSPMDFDDADISNVSEGNMCSVQEISLM